MTITSQIDVAPSQLMSVYRSNRNGNQVEVRLPYVKYGFHGVLIT